MNIIYLYVVLILFSSVGHSESLKKAVDMYISKSIDFERYRLNQQMAGYSVTDGWTQWAPRVAATYTKSKEKQQYVSTVTNNKVTTDTESPGLALSFVQPIYQNGKMLQNLSLSQIEEQRSEILYLKESNKLILNFMGNWYDTLEAIYGKRVSEKVLSSRTQLLKQAEAKYKAGLINHISLLDARVAMASARSQLDSHKREVSFIFLKLRTLLPSIKMSILEEHVDSFEKEKDIAPWFWAYWKKTNLKDLMVSLKKNSPDVMLSRLEVQKYELSTSQAWRDFFPTVTAEATGSIDYSDKGYDFEPWSAEASLTLTWTIFDGFTRWRNISKQQVQQKKAELILQQTTRDSSLALRQRSGEVQTYESAYDYDKTLLARSKERYQLSQEMFRAGRLDIDKLTRDEIDFGEARKKFFTTRLGLYRAAANALSVSGFSLQPKLENVR